MEKIQIGQNFFIPMPVVLVGTQVAGKANFMAVGWCARVNGNPPMIACGIANNHYTPKGMTTTKTFSVNIPSSDLLEKTDYCGIVSGAKTDKSEVFDLFYGSLKTAPMIKECPVNIECKLKNIISLGAHDMFIGEVLLLHVDSSILVSKDGIDYAKASPFVFNQGEYWNLGKRIGYYGFSAKK